MRLDKLCVRCQRWPIGTIFQWETPYWRMPLFANLNSKTCMAVFLEDFRAFEISFSTSTVFGGIRPLFLEVDHVDSRRPVDVGDFLWLKYCILYTETENLEQPGMHVEVIAYVTQPE